METRKNLDIELYNMITPTPDPYDDNDSYYIAFSCNRIPSTNKVREHQIIANKLRLINIIKIDRGDVVQMSPENSAIVGTYGLVLQKLIEDGHLRVSDSLVDVNNMPTEIVLLFDVSYNAPDGSVGEWSTTAMQGESFEDDRQALIVIEHNIANLERSINNRQQQQQQAAQDVEFHVAPRNSGSALSLVSPRSPERKRCVTNTRHAQFD
ncbi:uncharacterized protein TNCV_669351 [Trichonephila clavipes]|nr:uncharacterized protein TNCV_669351 [Trichonephila clavipes]